VSDAALALVMLASLGHAVWNALSRAVTDHRDRFYTVVNAVAVVAFAPLAADLALRTAVPASALAWWGASTVLEVAYFVCLARAYHAGSFLTAYPVARGSAPVLAALVGAAAFGQKLGVAGYLGVALVTAGVLSVNRPGMSLAGLRARLVGPGVGWALATGACTALYSVTEAKGARVMSPVLFTYGLFVAITLGKAAVDRLSPCREPYVAILRAYPRQAVVAGVFMFAGAALVITTLRTSDVAAVVAVRQLSIVFAAGIGALWLGERLTAARAASIALIVAGVLLVRG